jgi:mycothiol system anti-sigma-R factor
MSDCEKLRTLALEYLDGELDEISCAEIRVHIVQCPVCGQRLAFEGSFLSAIKRCATNTSLPQELHDQLQQLVRTWQQHGKVS